MLAGTVGQTKLNAFSSSLITSKLNTFTYFGPSVKGQTEDVIKDW